MIFTEFVKEMVARTKNLHCLDGKGTIRDDFGPSWIPDVYGYGETVRLWSNSGRSKDRRYRASAGYPANVHFEGSDTRMVVYGYMLGEVTDVVRPMSANVQADSPMNVEDESGNSHGDLTAGLSTFWQTLRPNLRHAFLQTIVLDASHHDNDRDLPITSSYTSAGEIYLNSISSSTISKVEEPAILASSTHLRNRMDKVLFNRCLFMSGNKLMGVEPCHTRKGDIVVVLYGGDWCFVLRPVGNEQKEFLEGKAEEEEYELVGNAFVDGVMRGELFEGLDGKELLPGSRSFILV